MKVKVEFIVETANFGKKEFEEEIELLINDIDPKAKLSSFEMYIWENK